MQNLLRSGSTSGSMTEISVLNLSSFEENYLYEANQFIIHYINNPVL